MELVTNGDCSSNYPRESSLEFGIIDSQLCAGDETGVKDTCQVGIQICGNIYSTFPFRFNSMLDLKIDWKNYKWNIDILLNYRKIYKIFLLQYAIVYTTLW